MAQGQATRADHEPAGFPTGAWAPAAFLAPALVVLLLFVVAPSVMALVFSFTNFKGLGSPAWVGLANYAKLASDPLFWTTLWNTLIYLVGVVPALVVLPFFLALLVDSALPGMSGFRAAFYLPVVISMVVAGLMWKWIFAETGLLNGLLAWVLPAVAQDPWPWLARPETALAAVMAVTIWKGLGYYMVIYLAGLQAIPRELHEVAALDGATVWQRTWKLTIPLMAPSFAFVAVVSAISALKSFTEIFVMTQGGPLNASATTVYYLYQVAFDRLDFGYANAIGMVLFVLIFGLSALNRRGLERGGAPS